MNVKQLGTLGDHYGGTIDAGGVLNSATPDEDEILEYLYAFNLGVNSNLIIDIVNYLPILIESVPFSLSLTLGKDLDSDGELDNNEIITTHFLSEKTPKEVFYSNDSLNFDKVFNLDLSAGDYLLKYSVVEASNNFKVSIGARLTAVPLEWVKNLGNSSLNFSGITTDRTGNIYVSSNSEYKSFIFKYDANGNSNYITSLPRKNNGIAIDKSGNFYLTGNVGDNAWLAKIDTQGNVLWVEQLDFTTRFNPTDDVSWGVAIDSEGNIYTTGHTSGNFDDINSENKDAWLAKYDKW